MKQLILFLLALVPMMASADVTKDGITYNCYENGLYAEREAYVTHTDETVKDDVMIPETVVEDGVEYTVVVIDENAFQDRAITSIVLPSTLVWIYEDAFQGCTSLKDVTLLGLTPPSANRDAFFGDAFTNVKIHVPTDALNAYKADDYWKQFATIDDKLGGDYGAGIAINAIHFPDETFRKFVSGKDIDTDQNGFLSDEEIAKVKEINVENKGIKSLKGIEFFTELETLNCARNELKELDVTKNTKLTYLQTRNNLLTTLDVTKNVELKVLRCNDNQLTALDVTKNTKLTYLGVWTNKLTVIDVSKNSELQYLDCTSNNITAIDVSKNTKMLKFGFWGNKISSIDVSMLPDLICLYTDSNPLKSLDVTKNAKLDSISCSDTQLTELDVSKNTELKYLNCTNNLISSLDVSKNVKLEELNTGENQLTSLDVTNNPLLQILYCYGNKLTSLDASQNTALVQLNCQRNQLTSLTMPKDGVLKTVYCHRNQIRGQAMDDMIASLPNQEDGYIALFNTDYIAEEGNVCTTDQVAALKAKGWTAYHSYNEEFVPYDGSDPSAIDGIRLQSEEDNAPAYNLNGQRTNGSHKGIVIKNGKKYITK